MDAVDPEIRDEMLRYMSKELKAVREQLEEERRKTRMSGTPSVAKAEDVDFAELREENETQQKRLEVLEEENARLWHHVARFESGEEDKPIALDVSRSDDRHARLFELYYMPKDQHETHCTKLMDRLKSAKEKRDIAREEARVANERADAADEEKAAVVEKVKETEENAEANRQKYKEAKSELKAARTEINDVTLALKAHEQRITDLTKEIQDAKKMAAEHHENATRFPDITQRNLTLLTKFVQDSSSKMSHLNEDTHLRRLPVYDFHESDTRLGFAFPDDLRPLLGSQRQQGNNLWSYSNTRVNGFADPALSRAVFLAPSHEVSAHDDGSYGWRESESTTANIEPRRHHLFYRSHRGWRYLGLYRTTSIVEIGGPELASIRDLHMKGLADKCLTNKDLVPPMVVKQAQQLLNVGAIRIVCFLFERMDDDGGLGEALDSWVLQRPKSLGLPPSQPTSTPTNAAQSGGKRSFTGPPTPIPKPGQSSSVLPASKNRNNKRPHKDSNAAASGSKNKKQKTKNGT